MSQWNSQQQDHNTNNNLEYVVCTVVNKIVPAESYTTSDAHGRVLLRISKTGNDSEIPMSVPGLLNRTVARYPDKFAYASKNAEGTWDKVTYRYKKQTFLRTDFAIAFDCIKSK